MEIYFFDPFKDGVVKPEMTDLDQFTAAYETAKIYLTPSSAEECSEKYQEIVSIMQTYAMENGYYRLYGRLPPVFTRQLFSPSLYPTPPTFFAQLWRHQDTWHTIDDADFFVNHVLQSEYSPMEKYLGDLSPSRERAICIVLALMINEAYSGYYVSGIKTALNALLYAAVPIRLKSRKAEDINDRNHRIGIYARKLLDGGTPPKLLTSIIADCFPVCSRQAYNVLVELGIKRK